MLSFDVEMSPTFLLHLSRFTLPGQDLRDAPHLKTMSNHLPPRNSTLKDISRVGIALDRRQIRLATTRAKFCSACE